MNAILERSRIALIAGRGNLPIELAYGLKAAGKPPLLVGIEDTFDDWIYEFDHVLLKWGQFGKLFKILKANDISQMLFAGSMNRPTLNLLTMDWGALKVLPEVLASMIGGDNSLFKGLINVFEKRGVKIIGAHEVMPELLSSPGAIAGRKPNKKAYGNIRKAFEACKLLGQLDIGQAAIAVDGRVVAVEGIEGTDNMLERVEALRLNGRLNEKGRNGVLVKTLKPNQELRVDLPAIGPQTILKVHQAGLAGISIEAGFSLILEREETLKLAKQHGIFIYGFDSSKEASET